MSVGFDQAEKRRLYDHGTGVLLVAGLCACVGYAIAEFVKGVTGRPVDSLGIAKHTGYVVGCIGIILGLAHLAVT